MARSGERSSERERFWREQVRQQTASGTSVRQFCETAGLSEASFYAWRRELLRRDAAPATPAFLPVTIALQLAGQEFILDLRRTSPALASVAADDTSGGVDPRARSQRGVAMIGSSSGVQSRHAARLCAFR